MAVHLDLSAPLYVELDLTSNCQLHCSYCSAAPLSRDEMPARTALRLVEEMGTLGVYAIVLSGGEPTLHPDILEIVHCASSHVPLVMLGTNGIRFSDLSFATAYASAAPKSMVAISLDSADAASNVRLRGIGSLKAFEAISHCARLGLTMCISTVLTDENVDTADSLIDSFFPAVKNFRFSPRIPRTAHEADEHSPPFWQKVKDFSVRAKERECRDPDLSIAMPFALLPVAKRGEIFDHVHTCCCPFTKIYIDARGCTYPCYYSAHPVNFLGSVSKSSIRNIWHSGPASAVRIRATSECICGNPPNGNCVPIRYQPSAPHVEPNGPPCATGNPA
jgi:MoaA/NifB/PqqE/SkfB family radical SAM enzyme